MSEWRHVRSKHPSCPDKLLSTSEFVTYIHQMNQRTDIAKKADALLWSPSAFYEERTKLNCVLVRGVVLDIETGIRMEDFPGYFPDLEMIVHRSFNFSDADHRYRVMIPTTDDMTGRESEMILRSLVRKLEEAGFGRKKDRNYRPTTADLAKPTHGVDITKMNSASLFYLPCNEIEITHLHEGTSPLNPVVWLGATPRDVIDLVKNMYDDPPEANPEQTEVEVALDTSEDVARITSHECTEDTPENLARIMAHFDRNGGYTQGGKTPFWALSKTLRSTGMDVVTIRQTLFQVAEAMHDPRERRSEIDGLIREIDTAPHRGRP